jgi:hypothetical protein
LELSLSKNESTFGVDGFKFLSIFLKTGTDHFENSRNKSGSELDGSTEI